jgi:hypothetical protein
MSGKHWSPESRAAAAERNREKSRLRLELIKSKNAKTCTGCKIEKTLDNFSIKRASKDGRVDRCKPCEVKRVAAWAAANPDKLSKHQTGPLKREYNRKRYERDREIILAERRHLRQENPTIFKERDRKNSQNNIGKIRAKCGRRRASMINATPPWLSFIQKALIEEFYELAQARKMQTGIEIHVDHIIPLQGKGVRGLHVPWNLQLLTEKENCSKHNKMAEA